MINIFICLQMLNFACISRSANDFFYQINIFKSYPVFSNLDADQARRFVSLDLDSNYKKWSVKMTYFNTCPTLC